MELERAMNPIDRCPVVVASRISLDQSRGQFDGILGMYQQQAKLMALEVLAVQKGVFPDTWLVGNAGEQPKIVNTANGLTGEIGVIRGGTLRDMQMQPGFMTNPAIDRLERAQRLTAGIPAEFGGESTSNIRTGRRGDAVLSAVVDFTVQETQKMLARILLRKRTRLRLPKQRLMQATSPSRSTSTWVRQRARLITPRTSTLRPTITMCRTRRLVPDINNLVIAGGQRLQMGTMSKEAFMRIDPLIEDVEKERDAVVAEQLEQSLLAGLQTQASQGALPPSDLARIMELVKNDHLELPEAVAKVQREAQERQAEQVEATAPEAQPGIAQPGAGAEAGGGAPAPAPLLFRNCWEHSDAACA